MAFLKAHVPASWQPENRYRVHKERYGLELQRLLSFHLPTLVMASFEFANIAEFL